MQARPYQQDCVNAVIKYVKAERKIQKKGIVVAPTGAGKSVIIALILKELPTAKVLILQPSVELLRQNAEKYEAVTGEKPAIYSASAGIKEIGRITYATLGSIKDKYAMFAACSLIIIDECHLYPSEGMLTSFCNRLVGTKMIGLTATPFRQKSSLNYGVRTSMLPRSSSSPFGEFIHIVQVQDVCDYWATLKYSNRGAKYRADLLELNTTGADYTEKSLHAASESIRSAIIEDVIKSAPYLRSILIYESCVQSGKDTLNALIARGVNAFFIDGTTPKEIREKAVKLFKAGEIRVLVNVGVFVVGFDAPRLDGVFLCRPIQSIAQYYQMVGRGTRPHTEKEYCAIMDYCGNFARFGRVENFVFENVPRSGVNLFTSFTDKNTGVTVKKRLTGVTN